MDLNIYSIKDSAAEAFVQPFFMHNDGLAIRAFQDNINSNDKSQIATHPEHFQLYKLGKYNDKTGLIESLDSPKILAHGIELKQPNEETTKIEEQLSVLHKLVSNLNIDKLKSEVN